MKPQVPAGSQTSGVKKKLPDLATPEKGAVMFGGIVDRVGVAVKAMLEEQILAWAGLIGG